MKLCTEARIDKFISVDHPVVAWLLERTCMILSMRVRGSDGLTAWARVRGRAFNQRMLSFLESVFYKLPTKGPQAAPDTNMGTRWVVGTFLGYSRNSNCYLVGTAGGGILGRPAEERWSANEVAQVQATLWSLHERPEVEVGFREPGTEQADTPGATC